MADYTPTSDVYGRFIEGLRMGQQIKEREETRAARKSEDLLKQQQADIARRAQDMLMLRLSSGDIRSGAEFDRALREVPEAMANMPMRTTRQVLGGQPSPMPTPTTRPLPFGAQGPEAPVGPMPSIYDVPARTISTIPSQAPIGQPYAQFGAEPGQVERALGTKSGADLSTIARFQSGLENLSQAYMMPVTDPNTGATVYMPQAISRPPTVISSKGGGIGELSGEGVPLSKAGIDFAAKVYVQTGKMPPMGMGAAGNRARIINRAGEMLRNPEGVVDVTNLITNAMETQANQTSFAQLQKQADNIIAFEKTANKNLALAKALSEKVDRTNVPIFNAWINAGRRSVTGNKDLAAFDLAVRTFINEYARVTTTVTGGGVTSDTARKEVEDLLKTAHTSDQFNAAADTAQLDMQNRLYAYHEQFEVIKARSRARTRVPLRSDGAPETSTGTAQGQNLSLSGFEEWERQKGK